MRKSHSFFYPKALKIGIDISQLAYEGGVYNYLFNLVDALLRQDDGVEYVLFYSSLRRPVQSSKFKVKNYPFDKTSTMSSVESLRTGNSKFKIKSFKFPPILLDLLWNKMHIAPIEWFVGDVDVFITSDWTEPPVRRAKKVTILYDLIVYKHPEETDRRIVETQKRKLDWVKEESDIVFCISEATKKDAIEVLGIEEKRLIVIYPGLTI